jgi:hypothetical protein
MSEGFAIVAYCNAFCVIVLEKNVLFVIETFLNGFVGA